VSCVLLPPIAGALARLLATLLG